MRRASLWLLGLGALVLAAGYVWQSAASQNQSHTRQLFAMDTLMEFTAYGRNAEIALDEAIQEVQRLDALLSAASPDSEISRLNGDDGGMVSLGGNIQVMGRKPDKSPWRIGVRDPEDGGYFAVLSLTDMAAVTSGGYERYFEAEGETYIHILDLRTGRPAESDLLSVTVVSEDGATADALSTALFLMGREEAVSFWKNHGGYDMILMTEDRQVLITERLEDGFETPGPFTVLHMERSPHGTATPN